MAIGLLVVLSYAQIPFFLYYPRVTNTILISESLDMLLFMGASLCVPLSVLLFALQPEAGRRSVRNAGVTLVAVLGVWLLSLVLMLRSPSLAVLALFVSTVSVAIVNVSISDPVYGLEWRRAVSEMLVTMMTIFALIEFSPIYYWITSSVDPGTEMGRGAAELELNLTYSLFPLAPFIFTALLLSWLWVPVASRILARVRPRMISHMAASQSPREALGPQALAAFIDLIAVVATVFFYYPYSAGPSTPLGIGPHIRSTERYVVASRMVHLALSPKSHRCFDRICLIASATDSSLLCLGFHPLDLSFDVSSSMFLTSPTQPLPPHTPPVSRNRG